MNLGVKSDSIATSEPKIQRSAALHVQIEQYLLEQIRSGAIKVGDRLESAAELAARLQVHEVTVQKALRRLKVAGILQRTPRVGTFVKSSPESTQIAIFFGPSITDEASHFYRAVSKALQNRIHQKKQECRIYGDINAAANEDELAALPSYKRYLADRSNCVFSGIILIGCDIQWMNFFKRSPYPPCVTASDTSRPGVDVSFDRAETARACVSHLASLGKKNLLYLRTVPEEWDDLKAFNAALDAAGIKNARVDQLAMEREKHYQEAVAYDHVCNLAREWAQADGMPDAIIVSDDIATRAVALALVQHGIKVPDEIEVVAWANEGIKHHYGIPVTKFEVSPTLFAKTLYEVLRARVKGTEPSDLPRKIGGHIVLPTTENPAHAKLGAGTDAEVQTLPATA